MLTARYIPLSRLRQLYGPDVEYSDSQWSWIGPSDMVLTVLPPEGGEIFSSDRNQTHHPGGR